MALAPSTREEIEKLVRDNRVLLFMKGNREQPQCGFSMQVVRVLDQLLPAYSTFDVLSDPVIREGIKTYSEWPTIPQLYVEGQFLGGCDIVKEMFENGELQQALGVAGSGGAAPATCKVTVSESAVQAFRQAQSRAEHPDLRLGVDARFQYSLGFGPRQPGDVEVEIGGGMKLLVDAASARRADGVHIDATPSPRGPQLAITNPNEPRVSQMSPSELKALLDSGAPIHLIDVRTEQERERARILGARLLDARVRGEIEKLPRDAKLVFHCHSGGRSQRAAREFACLGFTDVHNLAGGIDAWSQEIDPSVPRY